jgi:AhpD family alkylhydroperoxidase
MTENRNARKLLTEIKRTLQNMGKEAPDFTQSFMQFKEAVEKEGALDAKTKKLIAIALAVETKCEWCVSLHVKDALDAGATPAEIMECCFVASLMGGAPSLMFSQNVMKAIEEFSK